MRAQSGSSSRSRSGWSATRSSKRSSSPSSFGASDPARPQRVRGPARAPRRRLRTPSRPCRGHGCRTRRRARAPEQWRRSARAAPGRVRPGSGRRRRARGAARSRGRFRSRRRSRRRAFRSCLSRRSQFAGKSCSARLDRRHLPSIDSCLRRARGVRRTKPHREAVRGSGESPGAVDESVTGSANAGPILCRAQ